MIRGAANLLKKVVSQEPAIELTVDITKEALVHITILNIAEAEKRHSEFDVVISLVDHASAVTFSHPTHSIEVFQDVENLFSTGGPKVEHIQRILNFTRENIKKDSQVMIHCYGGQCRSTAMAIAIAVQFGAQPEFAAQKLMERHPKGRSFWPNSAVLAHAGTVLGVPELCNRILKWRNEIPHWKHVEWDLGE